MSNSNRSNPILLHLQVQKLKALPEIQPLMVSHMSHPEKSTRSISDLLKIPHHRSPLLLVVKDLYNLLNATGGVWSQLLPSCYSSHHYGDLLPSWKLKRGQWDSIGILMGYEWDINEILMRYIVGYFLWDMSNEISTIFESPQENLDVWQRQLLKWGLMGVSKDGTYEF